MPLAKKIVYQSLQQVLLCPRRTRYFSAIEKFGAPGTIHQDLVDLEPVMDY